MKVKLSGTELSIDLVPLFEQLSVEEKTSLADTLSCDTDVIDFVSEQIINKWTSEGSHGSYGAASPEPYRGLEAAWRKVAKASGDVAKREIERLQESLKRSNEQVERLHREIYEMSQRSYRP